MTTTIVGRVAEVTNEQNIENSRVEFEPLNKNEKPFYQAYLVGRQARKFNKGDWVRYNVIFWRLPTYKRDGKGGGRFCDNEDGELYLAPERIVRDWDAST